MNIAILGPGGISDDQHAPAVCAHPDTQLWSVLSRSLERANDFARRHNLKAPVPGYSSLDKLLADPALDAVIVATPDRLHEQQVIACAKAGKHVLLEKPMSTSVESCQRMIDACQSNNVVLALAYHLRWHDGHRKIQQMVKERKLGRIRHMRIHWTFSAPDGSNWRGSPEAGRWWALAANGTHCVDQVRWFLQPNEGEIVDIRCLVSRAKFDSPHDETSIVTLLFESGTTAEICVSVQFASQSRVELYGDDGNVRMEDTMGRHGGGSIELNGHPLQFEILNPFYGELNDFVEAIKQSKSPEVDGLEGKNNVAILLDAIVSSGVDYYSS